MSIKKTSLWLLCAALLLALPVAMTGCGGNGDDTGGGTTPVVTPPPAPPAPPVLPVTPPPGNDYEVTLPEDALYALHQLEALFPRVGFNQGVSYFPPGTGRENTFRWPRGQGSGFPGLFHPHLSSDAADSVVGSRLMYPVLSVDNNNRFDQNGIARWELVQNAGTTADGEPLHRFTFIQQHDVYWSDGTPMTLGDLYYSFWFISHHAYTGVRFSAANATMWVYGAEAFRADTSVSNFFVQGEVTSIPGLVLSEDERRLDVYLTNAPPSMLFFGIETVPLPRHHFADIAVGDTAAHINSRDNLIGFGPFIIDTVVPGETVLFRANENYWQGRPYLDYLEYFIIHPDMLPIYMSEGRADAGGFRTVDWEDWNHVDNVQLLGQILNSQRFFYFHLGTSRQAYVELTDEETGETTQVRAGEIYFVPRSDNHPITDVRFRRAMAYGLDQNTINMTIHHGLRRCATGIMHPFNTREFIDPHDPGPSVFDPELANRLLDEAGFLRGADGYRLDLNGNPFQVNIAFVATTEIGQATFFHYQNNMSDIGIRWELWPPDTFIDHNVLVNQYLLNHNLEYNHDIHMFEMGWNMGANPNPFGLWGHNQAFNLGGYTNEDWQRILADIASQDAWDADFLANAYSEWSAAWMSSFPAIPQFWPMGLEFINNRVGGWTLYRHTFRPDSFSWHRVRLTAPNPSVNTR